MSGGASGPGSEMSNEPSTKPRPSGATAAPADIVDPLRRRQIRMQGESPPEAQQESCPQREKGAARQDPSASSPVGSAQQPAAGFTDDMLDLLSAWESGSASPAAGAPVGGLQSLMRAWFRCDQCFSRRSALTCQSRRRASDRAHRLQLALDCCGGCLASVSNRRSADGAALGSSNSPLLLCVTTVEGKNISGEQPRATTAMPSTSAGEQVHAGAGIAASAGREEGADFFFLQTLHQHMIAPQPGVAACLSGSLRRLSRVFSSLNRWRG